MWGSDKTMWYLVLSKSQECIYIFFSNLWFDPLSFTYTSDQGLGLQVMVFNMTLQDKSRLYLMNIKKMIFKHTYLCTERNLEVLKDLSILDLML